MNENKVDFKGHGTKMTLAERSQGVLDALNRLRNEISSGAAFDAESDAALVKLESAISNDVPTAKAKAERPRSLRKPHTNIPALPSTGRRPDHKEDSIVEEFKQLKQKSAQLEKDLLEANKERARLQKMIDFLKREQAEKETYTESLLSQQLSAMQVLEAKFAETHRSMNKMKARETKIQDERLRSERLLRTKRRENEALQKKVIELQEEISKRKQSALRDSKKPRPKEVQTARSLPKDIAVIEAMDEVTTELVPHLAEEKDPVLQTSGIVFGDPDDEDCALNEGMHNGNGGQLSSLSVPSISALETSSLSTTNILPGNSVGLCQPSSHDEPSHDNLENNASSDTKGIMKQYPPKINAANPPSAASTRNGKGFGKSFSGPRNSLARSGRTRSPSSSARTPVTSPPQHQTRPSQALATPHVQPHVRASAAIATNPEPAFGSLSASQNSRFTDDSNVPPPNSARAEAEGAEQLATLHPNPSHMTLTSTVAIASEVDASNAALSKSASEVLQSDLEPRVPGAGSGAQPETSLSQHAVSLSTSPRAMGSSAVPLASIPCGHTSNSNNTTFVSTQAPLGHTPSFHMAPPVHSTGPSFTRVVNNAQSNAGALQTPGFVPVTPSEPMFASTHPPAHCEDDSNALMGFASPLVGAIAGPSPFAYVPAQPEQIMAQQQLYAGGHNPAMAMAPQHSSTGADNLTSLSQPGSPKPSAGYMTSRQMLPSAQADVPLGVTTRVFLPHKHPTATAPVPRSRAAEPLKNEINEIRTQANPDPSAVGGVCGTGRSSIIQHGGVTLGEVTLTNSCSAQDIRHQLRHSVTTPLQYQHGAQSSTDIRASPLIPLHGNAPSAAHLQWPQRQLSPSRHGSPKPLIAQQRGIRAMSPFRRSGGNLSMLDAKALLSPRINLRDVNATNSMNFAHAPFSRANTSAYFQPRTGAHGGAPLQQANSNALNWMAPCP